VPPRLAGGRGGVGADGDDEAGDDEGDAKAAARG
jgi:hypothetical protein